ncbi:MAG: hypothetical protein LBH17_00560, partial [Oscillospiraceae bacterium]|nr:hypothetical protein [Oscillospiraceae bacterium]
SIAGEREIDVAISTDGRETIMSLPNLTDYYFKIISEDTASPQFDYGDIDEQELTDALSNILGEYFRLTKDVAEAEKNVTLYFGAEGIVCDKHSIDITEDMAARLLLMGIDEIRRSPSLSAFIVNMMTAYGETPDLEAALAEAEESIRKTLSGSDLLLRMTVWIKDKTIIARRFDQIQGTDAVFHYQAYSTDAWRSLMVNLASGSMDFALDAEFKKNGSAWSGGMVLSAKDTYYEEEMLNAALTATDISIANERVTGQLEIIGELYGGDGGYFELRVALGDENGRQTILLTGLADDGYSELDLGSLFLSFATTDADAPTTPALDENFAVMVPGPFPASNYSDYNSDENTARIDAMASQLRIHAADREARGEVITGMILGALAETLWPTWNTDHYFGDDDFGNYYFDDYYDYDDYDGNDDFYFGDYFGEYGDYDEYYEYDEHGYDYGGFGDIGGYYGLAG